MDENRKTKSASPIQIQQWLAETGNNFDENSPPLNNSMQSDNQRTEDSDTRPKKLGKFEITGNLGSGGMGNVYLGLHPDLHIPVAIKTINKKYLNLSSFVNRFLREARLATKLNHPNVVRIYDVDKDGEIYFIVQEFVEGDNLENILNNCKDNRLEPSTSLRIIVGLTKALVEAEKYKIVHRDIKPGNILISKDGTPKLIDLGLAKQYLEEGSANSEDIKLTNSISSLGSPAYMPPEQVMDAKNVDIRADIFSLGATFYHMVTGTIPFTGESVKELLSKRIYEDAPNPFNDNNELSKRLCEIISKMIARNPDNRYQHPAELLQELEGYVRPADNKKKLLFITSIVLSILLAISLILLSKKRDPIANHFAQVEKSMLVGNFDQTLTLINEIGGKNGTDDNLLYVKGLCHLAKNESQELSNVIKNLKNLPNGEEKANHLKISLLISTNHLESALNLINEWLPKATKKLPFFQSMGAALQKLGRFDEARQSFQKALLEKPFFDFQTPTTIKELATLVAKDGKLDEANSLYLKAWNRYSGSNPTPSSFANYVVTLMNSGRYNEAARKLKRISESNPDDEMVRYLNDRLIEHTNQSNTSKINQIMTMIDDINQAIEDKLESTDQWSSNPIILTFLTLKETNRYSGRLGIDDLWTDQLVTSVKENVTFPIVDRTSLDQILREWKLNVSDLRSDDFKLKLRGLFPASVLVKGSFNDEKQNLSVNLQLVSVQSSELIAVINEKVDNGNRQELLKNISKKISEIMYGWRPIKGKVVAVDDNQTEINLGKYHGLKFGQTVNIYPLGNNVSTVRLKRSQPYATAIVDELEKFSALIRVENSLKPIVTGMLVVGIP